MKEIFKDLFSKARLTDFIFEFAVVVVGVIAAFALQDWADHQTDLAEETEFLQGFRGDLKHDLENLEGAHNDLHLMSAQFDELFALIEGQSMETAQIDSISKYYKATYRWFYFQPNVSTIQSVINSGKLEIIRDKRIRGNYMHLLEQYDIFETSLSRYFSMMQDAYFLPALEVSNISDFTPMDDRYFSRENLNRIEFKKTVHYEQQREIETLMVMVKELLQFIESDLETM